MNLENQVKFTQKSVFDAAGSGFRIFFNEFFVTLLDICATFVSAIFIDFFS